MPRHKPKREGQSWCIGKRGLRSGHYAPVEHFYALKTRSNGISSQCVFCRRSKALPEDIPEPAGMSKAFSTIGAPGTDSHAWYCARMLNADVAWDRLVFGIGEMVSP